MRLFFIRYVIIFLVQIIVTTQKAVASERSETEFVCATQCTCATERLSDVPIMKWMTIPMNRKSNMSANNNVLVDEQEDTILEDGTIIYAAFCAERDDESSVTREKFEPAVEALTLLYGPNTSNKTIGNKLAEFYELVVLDMQGYEPKQLSTRKYCEMQLHHNALHELHNLRYLNIQNIRIFPFLNVTNSYSSNQSDSHQHSNLTFLPPNDGEIMPYDEYKKRHNAISIFSNLTDLVFLRLFRCHIKTISWYMFDGLSNLRMLSLENNDITDIPEFAFYSSPQLQSLILSRNKIQRIRLESLAGLFHLENLDLSGNQLKTLSIETFAPLPKLYSLNLLGNPLENLFGTPFEGTNATQNLWIGSTGSVIVQEGAFSYLKHLEKLVLLGLNASKLHKGILRGLPKLKHLRISGNIESLIFDTFTGSLLLEELVLRHCSLKTVSVDAFYGLKRLKRLDLSRNKLQTLQPGVFDQLYSLKELILAHNNFVTLPRLVLANLQRVDMIRLEANPWNCSCDMIEWGSLNLNVKKVLRIEEQPCNYEYDKIPCTSNQTEVYVRDPKATPKCSTPDEYKTWNVLRAVYANVQCAPEKEMLKKFKNKIKKKIATIEHEDVNATIEIRNSTYENNDLADLSPYLSANNTVY